MSVNEVKKLKSEMLFGSSHCSCISCDTLRCFAKRKVKVKACSCSICKDPTACLYYSKQQFYQKQNHYISPSKNSNVKYTVSSTENKVFHPKRKSNYDQSPQDYLKNDISLNRNVNFLHEHLSNKAPDNYIKISIQDIFDRIKEIYGACSCKVCECVATTTRSTACRCKPCECNNCNSLMKKTDSRKKQTIQKSSPYAAHNMSNETIIDDKLIKNKLYTSCQKCEKIIGGSSTPEYNNCKCKPCDCNDCKILTVKIDDGKNSLFIENAIYNESHGSKPSKNIAKTRPKSCNCEPCQCDKCKPKHLIPNTVVVASMEDNLQRTACSCSPCECSSCQQASTATSLMRETSTGMTETFNNNCQCEPCFNETCRETLESCQCASRNSVMSKPFEKDTQNIDIHRALVAKENSNNENNGPNYTISVLMDVLNTYQEKGMEREKYDCKKLDCVNCSSKINMINSTKSLTSPFHNIHNLSTLRVVETESKECKCKSCECHICDKYKRFGHGVWKSGQYRSKCDCDICRCLYCGDLIKSESIREKNQSKQLSIKYSNVNYKSTLHEKRPINLLFPKIQCQNELTTKKNYLNKITYRNINNNKVYCDKNIKSSSSVYSILSAKECVSSVIHKNNSYHSVIDNNVVTTFLNDIMRNDELIEFRFDTGVKENTNNSVSSAWSFPETSKSPSHLCLENIVSNEREKYDLQKLIPEFEAQKICNSEKCIYCRMYPYTRVKNQEYDKGKQIIGQCFAETNLVSIHSKSNKSEINNDIDTKCKDVYNENELELSAKIIDNKTELLFWKTPTDLYALNKKLLKRFNKDIQERNILFKAKLLTSELLKILFKYQKANKEFKSHIQPLNALSI